MTQHPRRPAAKPALPRPATAGTVSPTGRQRPSKKAAPPPEAATPDTVEQAARIALDIAAHIDPAARGSVPVPTAHQLDSGLVDYGMWVEMFTRTAPPAPPAEQFRRGRIWT